jgi:TonB family protein
VPGGPELSGLTVAIFLGSKMIRTKSSTHSMRRAIACLAGTCVIVLAHAGSQQSEGQVVGSAAATGQPVVVPARMDVRHPLLVGSDYYPPESLQRREEGRCVMSAYVDAEGWVLAVQVLNSTGLPRLDAACIRAFDVGRVMPATVNGVGAAAWSLFTLVWRLEPSGNSSIPSGVNESATPRMAKNSVPRVSAKYYPAQALAKHEQGSCLMLAKIDAEGEIRATDVLKSSGSPSLDRACINAMVLAQYTPERHDGVPVDSSLALALYWRLK